MFSGIVDAFRGHCPISSLATVHEIFGADVEVDYEDSIPTEKDFILKANIWIKNKIEEIERQENLMKSSSCQERVNISKKGKAMATSSKQERPRDKTSKLKLKIAICYNVWEGYIGIESLPGISREQSSLNNTLKILMKDIEYRTLKDSDWRTSNIVADLNRNFQSLEFDYVLVIDDGLEVSLEIYIAYSRATMKHFVLTRKLKKKDTTMKKLHTFLKKLNALLFSAVLFRNLVSPFV